MPTSPMLQLLRIVAIASLVPFAAPSATPFIRTVTYARSLSPTIPLAALSDGLPDGANFLPLDRPLEPTGEDSAPPPEEIPASREFEWVHIAATFKECTAAKRAGAVTVWLNEDAATAMSPDNLLEQGYLGYKIVDEFADAICAGESGLLDAVVEGRRRAEEKAEEEERRAARDVTIDVEPSVAWDDPGGLEPATGRGGDDTDDSSPFATPPPQSGAYDGADGVLTRFCTACGAQMPVTARFCGACGERVPT